MNQNTTIIKTNLHRQRMARVLAGDEITAPYYKYFKLGTGGKTVSGELIKLQGNETKLYKPLQNEVLTAMEDIKFLITEKVGQVSQDTFVYEYIYRLAIDTGMDKFKNLIGKDITEIGLFDDKDILCYMETIAGYGPLQANHLYQFEFRIMVN